MSKWIKTLWQQGKFLITEETKHWSHNFFNHADKIEKFQVFANFKEENQGRSRVRIAIFEEHEDAARVVEEHNACLNIKKIGNVKELVIISTEAMCLLKDKAFKDYFCTCDPEDQDICEGCYLKGAYRRLKNILENFELEEN